MASGPVIRFSALIDNAGAPQGLVAAVDVLWDRRLVPFAADLSSAPPNDERTTTNDNDAARLVLQRAWSAP